MSQHDQVLANAAGATFRADANSALAAIFSNSSGATEPVTMIAYQFWGDTTTGILKQRNAANTAWIPLWTMATGVMIANAALAGNITQAFAVSDLSVTSINSGQISGLGNRVINGGCLVNSRGNAVVPSTTYQYGGADRHAIAIVSGSSISGVINSAAVTGFSTGMGQGVTGSWTTGTFSLHHRIRANNCQDLNSKTITISCKAYQNTGGSRNFKLALLRPTTTADTFSALTSLQTSAATLVATGTATVVSATFTLGASDATLGLCVHVYDSDAANTVVSKSYYVGDIDLRVGSVVPTYFEQRPYEVEKALCQGYCYPLSDLASSAAWIGSGNSYGTSTIDTYIRHPVVMRSVPTLAAGNLTAWATATAGAGQVSAYNYATSAYITITGALTVSGAFISKGGFYLRFTAATSFNVSGGAFVGATIDPNTTAYLDAEL